VTHIRLNRSIAQSRSSVRTTPRPGAARTPVSVSTDAGLLKVDGGNSQEVPYDHGYPDLYLGAAQNGQIPGTFREACAARDEAPWSGADGLLREPYRATQPSHAPVALRQSHRHGEEAVGARRRPGLERI